MIGELLAKTYIASRTSSLGIVLKHIAKIQRPVARATFPSMCGPSHSTHGQ